MASGGATLLLCALFSFFSAAHLAPSCPELLQLVSCVGDDAEPEGRRWWLCGDHHFRCNDSSIEIKFRGADPPFKGRKDPSPSDTLKLEMEDPVLSPLFADTDCDFLYSFPRPWPLFTPLPPVTPAPGSLLHQSYCKDESNYRVLFFELIKGYQLSRPCSTYDLYCKSKEEHDLSEDPALGRTCQLSGGADPPDPVLIWKLSLDYNSGSINFNIVSVGLSRHLLDPSCFNCRMTGGRCDSASAGSYTCGKPAQKSRLREMLIIVFTAAGVSILAGSLLLYLWCRRKTMKTASSSLLLSQTLSLQTETTSEKDFEVLSIAYPTHVFRYEELHEATDGFSPSNELGEGGHGAVYRGTLPDGRTVAIKRLYENSCRRAELFMNEIAILSDLRHPNLVALYGCTTRHSRELLLVYEFIPNGTIADHLHGYRAAERALAWPLRLRIAVETATALAYLHAVQPPIVHRDVKTNNILLDGDFRVKVGDFGLSRLFPAAVSHVSTMPQGTPGYVDPEYHRCYQLTDKSDVYSFGVVLAELISSKPAVDVTRSRHEINLSNMALGKIQNGALQELVDPKLGFETDWEVRRSIQLVAELAMRCLQGEGDTRPTMEGVLEVLRGIEDGLHRAEEGGDVDHAAGDDVGLHKNCPAASPDSVVGKWSSRTTTPDASG